MERRYGRANERYRTNTEFVKKNHVFKISLKVQSVICSVLLCVCILISFFAKGNGLHRKITYVLYHTNNVQEWKGTFMPMAKAAKSGSLKIVKLWVSGVNNVEQKIGFSKDKDNAPVKAKAQKSENELHKIKKSENEDLKQEIKYSQNEEISFCVPTNGEITSVFGERIHPINGTETLHTGIDIGASYGDTVISAAPGTVYSTGSDDANGKYVIIKHSEEFTTVYAHLSKISVSEGETVDANTKIGEVGSTGISTGPHLHFEIKINSKSVNPEEYISIKHRS